MTIESGIPQIFVLANPLYLTYPPLTIHSPSLPSFPFLLLPSSFSLPSSPYPFLT